MGGLCHVAAGTCFVLGVLHTTVATVVFIMAASPLVAAGVAWLLLRERIEARTAGAMAAAVIGIAVMMSEGLVTGDVTGILFALVTTLGFAGIAVVARWGGGLNMLPAVCLGAAFTVAAGWIMSGGDVVVTFPDKIYALASGGLLTATGATLFLYGAKFVPAGVLAFLTLTEVVLRPDLGLGRLRRGAERLHPGRRSDPAGRDRRRSGAARAPCRAALTILNSCTTLPWLLDPHLMKRRGGGGSTGRTCCTGTSSQRHASFSRRRTVSSLALSPSAASRRMRYRIVTIQAAQSGGGLRSGM